MEPLSKLEIEICEEELRQEFVVMAKPELWQRLFYTARLGAAYEQATKNQKEK